MPVGEASALAARITSLLHDGDLRAAFGEEGARQARRRFDFEQQVSAYLDWYAELVHG